MEVIKRNRKGNDGGIRRLYIARAKFYQQIMEASGYTAAIPAQTIEDYFTRIQLVPETAFHSEGIEDDEDQGLLFSQEIHFGIFRDGPELKELKRNWLKKKAIVLVVDNNLVKKLIGTDEDPLILMGEYDSGKEVQENNVATYYFAGKTSETYLQS